MLGTYPLFDSHLHIIDKRFPIVANNGYLPPAFSCTDYLNQMSAYQLCGGAIVSGSFQGFDQSYLVDALNTLGKSYVGVTQLPASVSDEEIQDLHHSGVRAVRFNLKRGGSEELSHLDTLAQRIHDIANWHVELYVDSIHLDDLYNRLINLPAVSIDHLGLSQSGFQTLLRLADKGIHIKATGFGRIDFEAAPALKAIYSANPHSLMFGSDLPSTRAQRPYSAKDFSLVVETLGEEAALNVFCKNAIAFYKTDVSTNTI